MELTRCLIAPIIQSPSGGQVTFDLGALVRRMFLFDHYILTSVRLLELPILIDAFSFDGMIEILNSGAITFDCQTVQTASLGPNLFINRPEPGLPRPPFHYSLATVSLADIDQHINICMAHLRPKLGLPSRKIQRLRKALHRSLGPTPQDPGTMSMESTILELKSSPGLLRRACSIAMLKMTGKRSEPSDIALHLEQLGPHDFKATANLEESFGLTQLQAHQVVESALLAIAHRNDRVELMKHHMALSGFDDQDLPIFGERLSFLQSALNPQRTEAAFQRVIELRGLPSIPPNQVVKLDARKLLSLRNSPDLQALRHWLQTSELMDDHEVAEYSRSFSSAIGSFITSPAGRVVRFLITSTVGLIPGAGQVIGIGLSALDQFLLDHVVPKPGPTALIDELYPSIFEGS